MLLPDRKTPCNSWWCFHSESTLLRPEPRCTSFDPWLQMCASLCASSFSVVSTGGSTAGSVLTSSVVAESHRRLFLNANTSASIRPCWWMAGASDHVLLLELLSNCLPVSSRLSSRTPLSPASSLRSSATLNSSSLSLSTRQHVEWLMKLTWPGQQRVLTQRHVSMLTARTSRQTVSDWSMICRRAKPSQIGQWSAMLIAELSQCFAARFSLSSRRRHNKNVIDSGDELPLWITWRSHPLWPALRHNWHIHNIIVELHLWMHVSPSGSFGCLHLVDEFHLGTLAVFYTSGFCVASRLACRQPSPGRTALAGSPRSSELSAPQGEGKDNTLHDRTVHHSDCTWICGRLHVDLWQLLVPLPCELGSLFFWATHSLSSVEGTNVLWVSTSCPLCFRRQLLCTCKWLAILKLDDLWLKTSRKVSKHRSRVVCASTLKKKMKMITLWCHLHLRWNVSLLQHPEFQHRYEEEKDLQSGDIRLPHWNKTCQERRVSDQEMSRV